MPPLDAATVFDSHGWTEKCTVSAKITICKNPPTININTCLFCSVIWGKKHSFWVSPFFCSCWENSFAFRFGNNSVNISKQLFPCVWVCVCVLFYMAVSDNMHLTCNVRTLWLVLKCEGSVLGLGWGVFWQLGWAECSHRDRTTNTVRCVWERLVLVGVVTVQRRSFPCQISFLLSHHFSPLFTVVLVVFRLMLEAQQFPCRSHYCDNKILILEPFRQSPQPHRNASLLQVDLQNTRRGRQLQACRVCLTSVAEWKRGTLCRLSSTERSRRCVQRLAAFIGEVEERSCNYYLNLCVRTSGHRVCHDA